MASLTHVLDERTLMQRIHMNVELTIRTRRSHRVRLSLFVMQHLVAPLLRLSAALAGCTASVQIADRASLPPRGKRA